MRSTGSRRLWPLLLACALLAAVAPALAPRRADAATYQVSIDTTALSGQSALLAFDLTDGDVGVNTTVAISSFTTDGTVGAVDAALTTGGVSGSLPGTVTLTDLDLLNSLVQGITLGNALSFTLDMSTASSGGGVPDAFAFSILDATTVVSLIDTDLDADVLLLLEANGTPGGNLSTAGDTTPSVPVSATPAAAVPLPATALLLAAGAALAVSRRR